MKTLTDKLANALHAMVHAYVPVHRQFETSGQMAAAVRADGALAEYDAANKRGADMTDDEILAELGKPDMRYTVETMPGGAPNWMVVDHDQDTEWAFGYGAEGRLRAIVVCRALNGT